MILIDSSAWIDFLRGAATPATSEVRRLVEESAQQIACCEPIAMELLAGARNDRALHDLELLVDGLPALSLRPTTDFRDAARIHRAVRRAGYRVRSLNDCLIAGVAIRHDAELVHKDADFEAIAQVTALRERSFRT